MRYAVTYLPDDGMDSVDTTIVEAPNVQALESHMEEALRTTGMSRQCARRLVKDKAYYIRNCDDVDYVVGE